MLTRSTRPFSKTLSSSGLPSALCSAATLVGIACLLTFWRCRSALGRMLNRADCRIHAATQAAVTAVVQSALFEAELVALGVGKYHPPTRLELAAIVNDGRPERAESFELLGLLSLIGQQVEMDAILHDFPLRNRDEDKPGKLIVRRGDKPELVARHVDPLDAVARDGTPERGDTPRIVAVECDVENSSRHRFPAIQLIAAPRDRAERLGGAVARPAGSAVAQAVNQETDEPH